MEESEWRASMEARLGLVDGRLDRGDKRFDSVSERFDQVDERFERVESAVQSNTELTQRAVDVSERTEEKTDAVLEQLGGLVTAVTRTRSTGRFIAWCAKWTAKGLNQLARWALPIVTLAGAVWAWLHAK